MRRAGRWMVGGALAILAVAGCTSLTSIDDLYVGGGATSSEEDGGGGGGEDANTSGHDVITSSVNDTGITSSNEDSGEITDGSGIPDGAQPDTGPVTDGCDPACFVMPTGFSLVAYGLNAGGMPVCPSGFGSLVSTVESPTLAAGACTCQCSLTSSPSCTNGAIANHFDTIGDGLCGSSATSYANNSCGNDGYLGPFPPGSENRFTPPVRTGGACSTSASKDLSKVSDVDARICTSTTPPKCATNAAKTCAPTGLTSPYKSCIRSTGDVGCPSFFPNKHLVGSSSTFTCTTNNCTCNVTATCKGTMNFFGSGDCTGGAAFSVPVADTCVNSTDPLVQTFASYQYAPDPLNASCSKSGTSTASAPSVTSPATVCCK